MRIEDSQVLLSATVLRFRIKQVEAVQVSEVSAAQGKDRRKVEGDRLKT